jgi:hypothetical protein
MTSAEGRILANPATASRWPEFLGIQLGPTLDLEVGFGADGHVHVAAHF